MQNTTTSIAPGRIWSFYVVIALALLGAAYQLVRLQVTGFDAFAERALDNRQQRLTLPAARGVVYDRNGVLLAQNVPAISVSITPAFLPEDAGRLAELYARLSELTGVPIATPPLDAGNATGNRIGDDSPPPGIQELVLLQETTAPYRPVVIAPDITREQALVLGAELRNLPGVQLEVRALRDYPTGALTAHVVGYMGPITEDQADYYVDLGFDPARDRIGYAGIENRMQDVMAGSNGYKEVEVDVAGRELRTLGEGQAPVPGQSVVLTIDVRLQAAAEAALSNRMKIENQIAQADTNPLRPPQPVTNGVAIAINPQTGEVLAMVSLPTYDNTMFSRFIPATYYQEMADHPYKPLFNNAISGEYPPGSVFKVAVAAGALQEGIVTADQMIFDPGEIIITNRYFPNDPGKTRRVVCYNRAGHGDVNFIRGIAVSCDVYFYALGGGYEAGGVTDGGLGIDRLHKYATMLGFDQLTGIELPGERKGLIPTRDWKRLNIGENWSTGDTYIASIGQGYVLSTPLQVLMAHTPFINRDGFVRKPTLIREVRDGEGNVLRTASVQNNSQTALTPYVIEQVSQGLRQVMIDGTGKNLAVEGIVLGGKSGTAEYCDNVAQAADRCQFGSWPAHAWMLAYAPYEKPEIAVVVFVYSGEEGSTVAGPVAQEIIDAYFVLKGMSPAAG
ncbi:MAG: penicillin-binding protein 2 [Chloroflexi bacterium]|nr:MAG: penicillin-binding protein 2 [Chloroflexota bacterium]RLT52145.1 MAG: penicillin-binding protein 2 [Chloroflexota bacterium]